MLRNQPVLARASRPRRSRWVGCPASSAMACSVASAVVLPLDRHRRPTDKRGKNSVASAADGHSVVAHYLVHAYTEADAAGTAMSALGPTAAAADPPACVKAGPCSAPVADEGVGRYSGGGVSSDGQFDGDCVVVGDGHDAGYGDGGNGAGEGAVLVGPDVLAAVIRVSAGLERPSLSQHRRWHQTTWCQFD